MGLRRRIATTVAATAAAAGVAVGMAAPATSSTLPPDSDFISILTKTYSPTGDSNPYDFDIVTRAAIATGVDLDLGGPGALTLFAPNDRAFEVTANNLNLLGKNYKYKATIDEDMVFTKIANSGVDVADILKYHVIAGAKVTGKDVLSGPFTQRPTMFNGDKLRITVLSRSAKFPIIVLGDRDGRAFNDLVVRPDVIQTQNKVVHSVSDVLLP